MKKSALLIACAALIVGGVGLASPQSADAGIRFSFGSGSFGHGGYGYNRGYSRSYGYGNYGHGGHYGSSWGRSNHYPSYGRGHYDYHPPALVPHGNHLHVIPGHYDYHRGGHGHWGH